MSSNQTHCEIQTFIMDFQSIALFIPDAPLLKPSNPQITQTASDAFILDDRKYSLASADTDCSQVSRQNKERKNLIRKRIKKLRKQNEKVFNNIS